MGKEIHSLVSICRLLSTLQIQMPALIFICWSTLISKQLSFSKAQKLRTADKHKLRINSKVWDFRKYFMIFPLLILN